MNALMYVKFRDAKWNDIVLLVTVPCGAPFAQMRAAEAKGFARIAEHCRHEYKCVEATSVCETADEVEGFEPV